MCVWPETLAMNHERADRIIGINTHCPVPYKRSFWKRITKSHGGGILLQASPWCQVDREKQKKRCFWHRLVLGWEKWWKLAGALFAPVVTSRVTSGGRTTHSPIQTSPNCPAPSFFTNLMDSRGISQASLSQGFCGLGLIQTFSNLLHKPSDCSNLKEKINVKKRLYFVFCQYLWGSFDD